MLIGTISADWARRFRSRSAARLSTSRDERQAPGKFDHGRLTNFPNGAPRGNEPNESNATTRGRKTRSSPASAHDPRRFELIRPCAGEPWRRPISASRSALSRNTKRSIAKHYAPPDYAPAPVDPPSLRRGFVTFGSFNHVAKIGDGVVRLWAQVLKADDSSRLVLKWNALREESVRSRLIAAFAAEDVAADRLELRGFSPHRELLEQ
jgi:hypothetical protein